MSLSIEQLLLAPIMEQRARELDLTFPGLITFTSGRRSLHEQAHAMAVNHLLDPKSYLMHSYIHASEFLEAISSGQGDSVDEVTEAFYTLLVSQPDLIKSAHLSGDAVDLRPMERLTGEMTEQGVNVVRWIRACADTVDFRTREGKLRRWHWQCRSLKNEV